MTNGASKTQGLDHPVKQGWVPPQLKLAGTVGDMLQGGGGKLSPMAQDPGDVRKPSGQG